MVDSNNRIIAGHGRVLAARKLGLVEVPCIELAHLTPAQRRAYVIADNKLALNAGWDEELLTIELGELKLEGFDLALTGFGEVELAGLLDKNPGLTATDPHSADQVAQIAGSIREFGFTNPVLLDGDNGVIAGHGRVLAARKLGLVEVPCIELAHLTPAQRRAYVIADNKR